jgi:hypothetical protein
MIYFYLRKTIVRWISLKKLLPVTPLKGPSYQIKFAQKWSSSIVWDMKWTLDIFKLFIQF